MSQHKEIHIIGGGTVYHVRPHLALSAPAYGKTARTLRNLILSKDSNRKVHLHLTKMAGGDKLETNEDVAKLIDELVADPKPKIIFMNAAMCDFEGQIIGACDVLTDSGKDQPRLRTSDGKQTAVLWPSEKVLNRIRKTRKDIFLVAFKTTAGAETEKQFEAGMSLLKRNSCNLVLANDTQTRNNMILTPEMASYGNTTDRFEVLDELVDIVLARSTNEFTRTEVVDRVPVSWALAHKALRTVVEYCVQQGAYEAFNGTTVGHFGCTSPLFGENVLLSSRRKQNYNIHGGLDLARVYFEKDGTVRAQGGKPSAGVRSQYELLREYNQFDCVVHFHCPMKTVGVVPVRLQKLFECGSHQCGQNTAAGVKIFGEKMAAVMLDKHGPNILFHSSVDPQLVIAFIREHFDLTQRTH